MELLRVGRTAANELTADAREARERLAGEQEKGGLKPAPPGRT
jgi:hypothetical protein